MGQVTQPPLFFQLGIVAAQGKSQSKETDQREIVLSMRCKAIGRPPGSQTAALILMFSSCAFAKPGFAVPGHTQRQVPLPGFAVSGHTQRQVPLATP
jgi:hypothetical protein